MPVVPPRRQVPVVGASVTVVWLAHRAGGTIEAVAPDGRELTVLTDEGDELRFALNAATGLFKEDGLQSGARLLFT
jgi:hypothetical protein